ncbi:hypothetical protein PV678_09715 [Streptomyces europaeiscabiei]|nr:hypothetical protein [Streptomyces europaeiscabiei]MDX3613042.1 hypothetical protein [Streptomyces europaeiscabiei]
MTAEGLAHEGQGRLPVGVQAQFADHRHRVPHAGRPAHVRRAAGARAMPPGVVRHHAVTLRQERRQQLVPLPQVTGEAVQEKEGAGGGLLSRGVVAVGEVDAVRGSEGAGGGVHRLMVAVRPGRSNRVGRHGARTGSHPSVM